MERRLPIGSPKQQLNDNLLDVTQPNKIKRDIASSVFRLWVHTGDLMSLTYPMAEDGVAAGPSCYEKGPLSRVNRFEGSPSMV